MAIDSGKLIDLAARGLPGTVIAKALGITDGAVTQLLDREDVERKVKEKQAELSSADLEALKSLEQVNCSLLAKISDLVEETGSLGEAVGAYEKLSRMHAQKQSGNAGGTEEGIKKITVSVPTFIQNIVHIHTSTNNEIIDINDRSMATMPTLAVHTLIKENHDAKTPISKDIDLDSVAF
jgi:hypothetical protein